MTQVVLVTGVAGQWGAQVAASLLAEGSLHVIGLDADPLAREIKGLDFIQADMRNALLPELLKTENVHTVCHLAFIESARPSEAVVDQNVMGTMKVMGACAEAGVSKIVLKSSTAVYGARADNSAFLTEDTPLNGSRRYGYTRDLVEIEAFCNGFRRQAPQVALTVLRFPSIVGPACDTPMTRFLQDMKAPTLLGFDPLMQVIHASDVVGALMHAVLKHAPGVFNVAAEGNLPLSKLMALAGKLNVPVFHQLAYWTELTPIEWDYLRYPWVGDLARMKNELGFTPRYTAAEALREFATQQRVRPFMPDALGRAALAYDEERLRDTIERRRLARAQTSDTASTQGEARDE